MCARASAHARPGRRSGRAPRERKVRAQPIYRLLTPEVAHRQAQWAEPNVAQTASVPTAEPLAVLQTLEAPRWLGRSSPTRSSQCLGTRGDDGARRSAGSVSRALPRALVSSAGRSPCRGPGSSSAYDPRGHSSGFLPGIREPGLEPRPPSSMLVQASSYDQASSSTRVSRLRSAAGSSAPQSLRRRVLLEEARAARLDDVLGLVALRAPERAAAMGKPRAPPSSTSALAVARSCCCRARSAHSPLRPASQSGLDLVRSGSRD